MQLIIKVSLRNDNIQWKHTVICWEGALTVEGVDTFNESDYGLEAISQLSKYLVTMNKFHKKKMLEGSPVLELKNVLSIVKQFYQLYEDLNIELKTFIV